jgi:FSR family fosmidomycin resistance protein-like MFS transporter
LSGTAVAAEQGPSRAANASLSVVLVVALGHTVNDLYSSFLNPLLPRIMGELGLSITLAATLAMAFSLAASVLQPLFGYLADRYGRRLFVAMGPILSGVFLSLIGVAPTFTVLVILLILGGLGSASFHPPGASFAAAVGQGRGSGTRLSLFAFGGAMGFALGPLVAVALVARSGLAGMWVAMVPGILVGVALFVALPRDETGGSVPPPPSPGLILATLRGPLGILFAFSALFAFAQRVYLTMSPIAVAAAGGSELAGAVGLSVYLGAQGVGTLVGGVLCDRVDRQKLLATLATLAVPAHVAAVAVTPASAQSLVAAAAAGFLAMSIIPPVVVMAQEMLPRGAAVGSGIVMGLAWAAGSVGVLFTGALGDWIGPQQAAIVSMPVLLGAVVLALSPALRAHRRPGER